MPDRIVYPGRPIVDTDHVRRLPADGKEDERVRNSFDRTVAITRTASHRRVGGTQRIDSRGEPDGGVERASNRIISAAPPHLAN